MRPTRLTILLTLLLAAIPSVEARPRPLQVKQTLDFKWPVRGRVVLAFCFCSVDNRNGIDIAVREGTFVRAAAAGIVAYAGNELRGYGKLILLRHRDGWVTVYAYNSRLLVKQGDCVEQGQSIAVVGNVGTTKTSELHFEMRKGIEPVDPLRFLPN